MKTAIIGLGVIGKVHLETLIMQGRTVSALCDIDAEEAKNHVPKVAIMDENNRIKEMINYEPEATVIP